MTPSGTGDRDTLRTSAVLAGHTARAWAGLVLRSFARETNLALASTRVLVVGDGDVADALTGALVRLGSRVRLVSDHAAELLTVARRHAVPAELVTGTWFVAPDIDVLIVTGHHHPPLTVDAVVAGERPLTVVDAALSSGVGATAHSFGAHDGDDGASTVRNLTEFRGPRPIFGVPPVDLQQLAQSTADVRSTYAGLLTAVGADQAETELAKVLLV